MEQQSSEKQTKGHIQEDILLSKTNCSKKLSRYYVSL